jgi:hypothetical protein
MKKQLKKIVFGSKPIQRIKAGIAKGIKMNIDINSKSQRVLGLDEREIQKAFKEYSKMATHFFDIGGSDGYYSLIYRKFNPSGVIYNFEAQEHFKKEQVEHFNMNSFNPIQFQFSKFVSDLNDDKNISIDELFKETNQKLLFKIDVDGGEMDVLNGMQETIKNNTCYFIIETHSVQLEKDCLKFLENCGYKTTLIDVAWYRKFVPEDRPTEHNRWFTAIQK